MKRVLTLLLCAAMCLSLFSGCNGESQTPSDDQKTGEPRDTVVIALGQEPALLDPQLAGDSYSGMVILNLHDPLIRRDSEGQLVPSLAESWTFAEDNMSITFQLRKDVKFQDGSALTAEDVAFSLNRAIEKPQAEIFTTAFESCEVLDEYTVRLNLKYPEIAALQYLTQTNNCIVSKAYVEKVGDENYAASPCGTGPYRLVDWQKGSKLVFEANPDYFLGAPPIQHLEIRILKEATTATVALETGDVDMVVGLSALDVPTVKGNPDLAYYETESTSIWNLAFNTNMAPFDNPKVRRALAMAVNRDEIVENAMDGGAIAAEIILPPQTTGNPGADAIETPPYDPEGAKALLAEAGYPEGFSTQICVREDYTKKIGTIIQNQWRAIGVDAEIVVMERAALLADIKAGKLPCYTVGNVSMTTDASFLLGTLTTINIPDSNFTFYSNPAFDALADAQAQERDEAKRLALVTEALQMEARDVPRIILIYMTSNIACNKDLNAKVYPASEGYFWHELSWK